MPGALHAQAPAAPSAAEPWNAPHFTADPKALYEAASAVAVPDGADVTELDEDETYTFDDAGRMLHVGHMIYKVVTQTGAENWDALTVDWEPWHQSRPVIKARVIGADGSVHTLDPKTITELAERDDQAKEYSDGKRLRAPFPAIAAGVVVEEEYTETETEPLFSGGRVGNVELGLEGAPVAHSRVIFDAPAALTLRTSLDLLPDLKPVRDESNGRVRLTYDVGLLDSIDPSPVNLPPDVVRFPTIGFSTGGTWQHVASEYAKLVDARADATAVKAVVSPLIAGKKTDAEKEAAIVDYLDREVRYTGIEFGDAALVPHDPAETLAKKYGDCKDKATLMVAMLRAAGIPAYVALLNAGSRMDVPQDLPGMGMFDHAIVYVPGKHGVASDIWIDATDRYAALGQLPMGDQGRRALIARAETTALMTIPVSSSTDNGLVESRTFTLADNGFANVVEITRPRGAFESDYRSYYADKPDKDMRDRLRGYVQGEYIADDLSNVERTDPADLGTPFALTLACVKAKRGYTGLENAQAAIRLDSIFDLLPQNLKQKDNPDDQKNKPKKPRTVDWWLNMPFTTEWDYRLIPPAGFVAKELPKDASIQLGPALLTEKFNVENDGAVSVKLVFDTVKRRFTVDEATAMRNQVADIIAGPALFVNFEPKGAVLLREGKVKEALASYRALVTANPNSPVHHLQVASVLLDAGMGEAARDEARLAVKLDPASAVAERTLAQILEHDLVGRELRPGSDFAGAAEAFRAAVKLDPDDHESQGDLAILLEYDPAGFRYGSRAHMKEAIAEYQKLGQDKLADIGLTNNLVFAYFYGGDYADAYKAAQALNPQPRALMSASMAVMQGSKAGLAEANKLSTDDASFKETVRTAGQMLMNMRQYPLAADFFESGAAGDDAARLLGLANTLRNAPHYEQVKLGNTPEDVVKRNVLNTFNPDLTEGQFEAVYSRNALKVFNADTAENRKKAIEAGKMLNSQLAREDSSIDVTSDMLLQMLDPKGEGDDSTGYREKIKIFNNNMAIFVVKENGQYKVLDTLDKPNSIGLEMLDRIQSGDLKGAKALLDWIREDQHLEGGDDPFGGPVFPRFWIKGEAADAAKMKLAAAAILVGTKPTVAQGVSVLEDGLKNAVGDRERSNIELALAVGYALEDNFAKMFDAASALLKQEPTSRQAFIYSVLALQGMGRYDEAMALADERLKLLENDADAFEMKMRTEAARGNYAASIAWAKKLSAIGKEDADLLNGEAWNALFTGKVTQDDVATAIRATQLQKDSPAILHTLACLYAETGDTKDAHDLLLRAMDDWSLDEPNDAVWYVLGRIAEQYGEREIAMDDYRKLKKPDEVLDLSTSTYELAQMRLKAMGAGK